MKRVIASALLLTVCATEGLSQQYRTEVTWSSYTYGNGFFDGQQTLSGSVMPGAQQQSRTAAGESSGTVRVAGRADTYVLAQAGSIRSSSSAFGIAQTSAQDFVGTAFVAAESQAFTRVYDRGVFSMAGLANGTVVTLTAFLGVSGSLSASSLGSLDGTGGQAFANWFGKLGAGSANGGAALTANPAEQTGSQLQTGIFYFSANITLGADVDIQYGTQTIAFASAGLSCSTSCPNANSESTIVSDFASTLTWGGISGAKLADGTVLDLSRLSMQSASGFNYIAPSTTVPEPSSFVLLASALVAVWFGRRRVVDARVADNA
jgi:PEP-CTERM motif